MLIIATRGIGIACAPIFAYSQRPSVSGLVWRLLFA